VIKLPPMLTLARSMVALRRNRAGPPAAAHQGAYREAAVVPGSAHVASAATTAAPTTAATPLAALLSQHILRDGEIILLVLKPSSLRSGSSCCRRCDL
jgi:hypothetical protein